MRYQVIKKFCEVSGYTERAVRTKIHRGVWVEKKHYRRAPDGRLMIDTEAVTQWVENPQARLRPAKQASA